MKEFIGKKVTVLMEGMSSFLKGEVVNETKDMILLKGDSGKIFRLIKSHVIMFSPEEEPEEFSPLCVLHCERSNCPGVQLVLAKKAPIRSDFDVLMKGCPCRNSECRCGFFNDITLVPRNKLVSYFDKLFLGDYPKAES